MMIHVYGIGSPHGDDQAAWLVINELKQVNFDVDIALDAFDRPGVKLVDMIKDRDHVILIDAVQSQSKPGIIHELADIEDINAINCVSSHGFGVAQALELCHVLNCLPKKLAIYGIEVEQTEPFAGVSELIKASCKKLTTKIILDISKHAKPIIPATA